MQHLSPLSARPVFTHSPAVYPLQEPEIPIMIIECCSQEKTFVRYYALLASRFCMLRREFQVRVHLVYSSAPSPHPSACGPPLASTHPPLLASPMILHCRSLPRPQPTHTLQRPMTPFSLRCMHTDTCTWMIYAGNV
jgi:MA3 domain